ncbi:hypothetical protein ABB25_00915 [Stenotrophomonas koreensis]|uniref:Chemotaxis protein n=1 Tax=Stenotrophomonas koreensis TaxID=266128 RepID=A0A0R0BUF3_9GAMM|nr:hypothetical protein [Stenotrophomonas koreensis]KRG60790.1 hypothetical protein ABB25_00915 [Stenotrophomonas koreensis]
MSRVIDALHAHVIDVEQMAIDAGDSLALSSSLQQARRAVASMARLTNAAETALLFLQGEPADQLRAALADAVGGA